ncbi:MAG: translation initiation factor IF-2 subunit beta [Candidatus Woesearchaeota archaeon]
MKYEDMLERGESLLPESVKKSERFEIPKVTGHLQGNKTVITNFSAICSTLRCKPEHLLKFLQRELAAPAQIEGPRLVLGRKLTSALVNQKVEEYANVFIICPQCRKPDTQLTKEGKVLVMKCTACGAKHTVKAKI